MSLILCVCVAKMIQVKYEHDLKLFKINNYTFSCKLKYVGTAINVGSTNMLGLLLMLNIGVH